MDPPATLDDYFLVVDDFFRKTFRDDSTLFFAVKSKQYSTAFAPTRISAPLAVDESKTNAAQLTNGVKEDVAQSHAASLKSAQMPTCFCLSPRMSMDASGRAVAKLKMSVTTDVIPSLRCTQGIILNDRGVVTAAGKVTGLVEGLMLGGRIAVNTIAPASEDVTALSSLLRRDDFYSSLRFQRNGLGSTDVLVNCGVQFFNFLVAAGFERQRLSYLEVQDGPAQLDAMYVGVGFTGVNWSIAGKMARSNDVWNAARIAVFQSLTPSTAVACAYNFDTTKSRTQISVGVMQGMRLRVPAIIYPKGASIHHSNASSNAGTWISSIPLVGAIKVQSDGICCGTIRGMFNNAVRWGIVLKKNMITPSSGMKVGVTLSIEPESAAVS